MGSKLWGPGGRAKDKKLPTMLPGQGHEDQVPEDLPVTYRNMRLFALSLGESLDKNLKIRPELKQTWAG